MTEKRARILIVDDSDDARTGLMHFFEAEGFEADEADSGEAALEVLRENSYDIVLSDLRMQNIDGVGVLKAVRAGHPGTEVIIMTAYASVDTAVGALKLGAYDYISKPLNLEELLILVEKCLEKQRLAKEVIGLKQVIKLYELSKGISSVMDLDELLELITRLAADALNAEGGSIMLFDENTGELVAKAATGRRSELVLGRRVKLGERIAGYAADVREYVKIDGRVEDDARFAQLDSYDGINSGLTVPLVRKKRLLGVINLHRSELKQGFTENDIKLLAIFAAQAAIAIENSSLLSNLIREKDKLSKLFSEMSDGAVLLDRNLRVIMHNNAALRLLGEGLDNEDIRARLEDFESAVTPDMLKEAEEPLYFELSGKKGAELYLSAAFTEIRDDENKITNGLLVLRNVTESKKEEKAKKNFLRMMSHKLRTPLTSIIGFSSLLSREETYSRLNGQEKEFLNSIETDANRLSDLVDRFLRFTLLESESIILERGRADIEVLVDTVLSGFKPMISETGTQVVKEGLSGLPELFLDRDKFREAVENIIENALKFNTSETKKLEIKAARQEDAVRVEIRDNGPGIPQQELESIFEKFRQLEKCFTGQVEGVGLGLTLARRIIEAHGGRLWAESRPGEGSVFILTVPLRNL